MNAPAIVTPPPPAGVLDVTRLADVPTAELRDALRDGLRLTVSHLAYVAHLWRELESRGEDLTPLRQGIGAWLSEIGSGRVLPETVVKFIGTPAVLRKVAVLPVAEQRDIADGKQPPPVVRYSGGHARPGLVRKEPELPGMPPRPALAPRAGEPSDAELDAACQPAKPQPKPLEMLAAMIGNASPGDAAELVAECVAACGSAQLVAMRLIPLLERLARAPAGRKLAV